jgi:hypothetical protein
VIRTDFAVTLTVLAHVVSFNHPNDARMARRFDFAKTTNQREHSCKCRARHSGSDVRGHFVPRRLSCTGYNGLHALNGNLTSNDHTRRNPRMKNTALVRDENLGNKGRGGEDCR